MLEPRDLIARLRRWLAWESPGHRLSRHPGPSPAARPARTPPPPGPPPSPTYVYLERFLAGEVPEDEFEAHVYAHPELEGELGEPAYMELLSFDYRQAHADLALAKLVTAIHERGRPGLLRRDRAYRLARGLLDGSIPVPQAVHGLANLWYDGHEWEWLPFVYLSSELDGYPDPLECADYAPELLARYKKEWEERMPQLEQAAVDAAREFLRTELPEVASGPG